MLWWWFYWCWLLIICWFLRVVLCCCCLWLDCTMVWGCTFWLSVFDWSGVCVVMLYTFMGAWWWASWRTSFVAAHMTELKSSATPHQLRSSIWRPGKVWSCCLPEVLITSTPWHTQAKHHHLNGLHTTISLLYSRMCCWFDDWCCMWVLGCVVWLVVVEVLCSVW